MISKSKIEDKKDTETNLFHIGCKPGTLVSFGGSLRIYLYREEISRHTRFWFFFEDSIESESPVSYIEVNRTKEEWDGPEYEIVYEPE